MELRGSGAAAPSLEPRLRFGRRGSRLGASWLQRRGSKAEPWLRFVAAGPVRSRGSGMDPRLQGLEPRLQCRGSKVHSRGSGCEPQATAPRLRAPRFRLGAAATVWSRISVHSRGSGAAAPAPLLRFGAAARRLGAKRGSGAAVSAPRLKSLEPA